MPSRAPPKPPTLPAAELPTGASPREILNRIANGDPLGLEVRSRARLDVRAVLVDLERIVAGSLARAAYDALRYNGFPTLAMWLDRIIDRTIDEQLEEDRIAERAGQSSVGGHAPSHAFFAEALGVDPVVARRACVVFNDLPDDVRRVYWALVIKGRAIERCVSEGMGSQGELEARFKRALLAISLLEDPGSHGEHEEELT